MRKSHPFTLIEMVAALAVLALIAGLVVGSVRGAPLFLSLDAASAELQAFLSQARREALVRGTERVVQIDSGTGTFTLANGEQRAGTYRLPAAMQLKTLPPEATARIRFFPDGSGEGPQLRLERDGSGVTVTVSPLTGLTSGTGDPDDE